MKTISPIYYVSYWENPPGQKMPAYVALALISLRRALGNRFLLLTPQTIQDLIDPHVISKDWCFKQLPFTLSKGIESIVAKSDFIRMAYIHQYGGVWVDADTLCLRDPTNVLFPTGLTHRLHWYSECLFASRPGNPLLAEAVVKGLEEGVHAWGNPGGIKDSVMQAEDAVVTIPEDVFDPGYNPRYNFASCEVMHRQDLRVDEFLSTDVSILKLYNTYFRRTAKTMESIEEFLAGGTLLAKLFLHIEADHSYWLEENAQLTDIIF
jgi:hypothetical protein